MNRQLNLRDEDLDGLEAALVGSLQEASADQQHFVKYILHRAREGKAAVTTKGPGWLWTWAYNF